MNFEKPRTTGMKYEFLVSMEKADGSDKEIRSFIIIGLNIADAWKMCGIQIAKFMNGPDGRKVTGVQLEGP